jgi:dolichol-phosphate mannosyltransferase
MNKQQSKPLLSIIVAVYEGSSLIGKTISTIFSYFEENLPDVNIEIISVDDGSKDDSYSCLLALRDVYGERLRVIRLSRNYGAVSALQAGIDHAKGDCVSNISQDMQDTPEMVAAMFRSWRDENSKVNFIIRTGERNEPFLKKVCANIYHRLFRWFIMPDYPSNGLGVCLIDKKIADIIRKNRERNLDIATYIFSLGYNHKVHPFPRPAPKLKHSHWTFTKNINLAIDNFTSFSYFPIRMMSVVGIIVATSSFLFAVYVII